MSKRNSQISQDIARLKAWLSTFGCNTIFRNQIYIEFQKGIEGLVRKAEALGILKRLPKVKGAVAFQIV